MKKFMSVILVLMLVLCVAGCGDSDESSKTESGKTESSRIIETVKIDESNLKFPDQSAFGNENEIKLTVSVPEKALGVIHAQVQAFVNHYPNIKMDIKLTDQSDSTGADIFEFPSDQLSKLMQAQSFSPAPDEYFNDARMYNLPQTVEAATVDNKLYAYPITSDNGCCLVYDRSIVTDADASSLESILESCKKCGKVFVMDCSNAFFSSTFAFTGGVIPNGFENDGTTQKFRDYDEERAVDTLMAFADLMKKYKDVFVSKDNCSFKDGNTGAAILGAWGLKAANEDIGENFGAVKLPAVSVMGDNKQMISMQGYKYIGVNSNVDPSCKNTAHALASFLSSEECQRQRLEKLDWIPSSISVIRELGGDSYLSAVLEQSNYSVPEVDLSDAFWNNIGDIGTSLYDDTWKPDDRAATTELLRDTMSKICE